MVCNFCEKEAVKRWKREIPACVAHYAQLLRNGKIGYPKTKPNEIEIKETHAEIITYNMRGERKSERILVSLHRVPFVSQYRWNMDSEGYVSTKIDGRVVYMHRLFLNPSDKQIVDHANHNRADNRDENLRLASYSQNSMNTCVRIDNKSEIKGVYFNKRRNEWVVEIRFNKKRIVRYCKDKDEAVKTRKELEERYHKEFSYNGKGKSN